MFFNFQGEKCYRCEVCPYASISARHLESHLLIHTDQKPYMCTFCDQSFRQKQLLKRHENIYHNPDYVATTPKEKCHKCPTCKKTFRHKGNLMRHMASHDPNIKQENHKNGTVSQIRFKRENEDEDEEFYEGEEDEEEEEMEQEMGDNPDDGYVVVEVIQMANGGEELGDEQYVDEDVVEEDMNEMEEILEEEEGHNFTLDEHIDDEVIMSLKQTPRHQGDDQDISSFIGFETDSENEGDGKRLKQPILGN